MVSRHLLAPIGRDVPSIAAHHQIRQQAGPAGLVGGAQTLAGVAVEIFVELQQIPPVWIVLKWTVGGEHRPPSICVAAVNVHQPLGDQRSDFLQIQFAVAQAGHGNGEIVAEEAVELLQCLDQGVIGR